MKRRTWTFCLSALVVALGLAALSPLASSQPDGLEKVAADHGQAEAGALDQPAAPMADYQMPGVKSDSLRTILAGLAGTLGVFAAMLIVGRLAAARRRRGTPVEGTVGAAPPPR